MAYGRAACEDGRGREARVVLIGVETGGTKVVCAAGTGPRDLAEVRTLPTTTPAQTLAGVAAFIEWHERRTGVEAVGIAAFGPVELDPRSPTFGTIGATPKPGWQGTRLVDAVRSVVEAPVTVETDVTAAAIGEHRWGAGTGLDDLAYVTVGTGIGVGAIVAGRPLHGSAHPEAGHLSVRLHHDDDFAGVCRLHGICLEGLACGPAISARWGRPADDLDDLLPRAVLMEAFYLAQLTTALLYVLSPARIVLGGGVLALPGLLDAVRTQTADLLNGALAHPAASPHSDAIVSPALGARSGVVGALTLASDLVEARAR
jgi:fructokinase